MQKFSISLFSVLTCLLAHADESSPWSYRVGVTSIVPKVTSGDLSAPSVSGSTVDVSSATQLAGGINYRINDKWSVDMPLGLPFEHNMYGDGAISGVGKISSAKALPATVLLQYQLPYDHPTIKPYAGAGLTYAYFFDAKGTTVLNALTGTSSSNPTTLTVESKFASSIQLGSRFNMPGAWFIDMNVIKTFLKTSSKLSTGQTIDISLDPWVYSLSVGRSF